MVNVANQASLDREHERTERRRTEGRYDDLLRAFMELRRDGYAAPLDLPLGPITATSTDDADEQSAMEYERQQWNIEVDD
jgi:hypothetical protein